MPLLAYLPRCPRRPFVLALWALLLLSCKRSPGVKEEAAPVELWLGGDVHVGNGEGTGLSPLAPMLEHAYGIVNLEGPIGSGSFNPPEQPGDDEIYEPPADPSDLPLRLQNNAESLPALRRNGVRVMGIANNHSGDRGPKGPEQTAKALYSTGILPAGEPAGPAVFSAGGKKIVVSAFDLSPGVVNDLPNALAQAKQEGDFLITTFHISGSSSYLPRPELRAAVDIALEAGSRVIAAHGTHALGPLERRGDAVIAWGLGNLLFDCPCTDELDGAILYIRLEGSSMTARIVPVDAGLQGKPARPAHNPGLIFGLFDALGSSPLRREIFRGFETAVF